MHVLFFCFTQHCTSTTCTVDVNQLKVIIWYKAPNSDLCIWAGQLGAVLCSLAVTAFLTKHFGTICFKSLHLAIVITTVVISPFPVGRVYGTPLLSRILPHLDECGWRYFVAVCRIIHALKGYLHCHTAIHADKLNDSYIWWGRTLSQDNWLMVNQLFVNAMYIIFNPSITTSLGWVG